MKDLQLLLLAAVIAFLPVLTQAQSNGQVRDGQPPRAWSAAANAWVSLEQFWLDYAASRGGLTWGRGAAYPPYREVNENDTFLVELDSGPCLMEFFHSRWRRANDVRRWDPAFNDFGGCPRAFD